MFMAIVFLMYVSNVFLKNVACVFWQISLCYDECLWRAQLAPLR